MIPANQVNLAWPSYMDKCNEYEPMAGDAVLCGRVKAGVVRVWWQIQLCDMSALKVLRLSAIQVHVYFSLPVYLLQLISYYLMDGIKK